MASVTDQVGRSKGSHCSLPKAWVRNQTFMILLSNSSVGYDSIWISEGTLFQRVAAATNKIRFWTPNKDIFVCTWQDFLK